MGESQDWVDDFNTSCGIDDSTKPITGFPYPIITSAFFGEKFVYVALFHAEERKQYYFAYDYKEKQFLVNPKSMVIEDSTETNFPQKCFWNDEKDEIYTFYRQG